MAFRFRISLCPTGFFVILIFISAFLNYTEFVDGRIFIGSKVVKCSVGQTVKVGLIHLLPWVGQHPTGTFAILVPQNRKNGVFYAVQKL